MLITILIGSIAVAIIAGYLGSRIFATLAAAADAQSGIQADRPDEGSGP